MLTDAQLKALRELMGIDPSDKPAVLAQKIAAHSGEAHVDDTCRLLVLDHVVELDGERFGPMSLFAGLREHTRRTSRQRGRRRNGTNERGAERSSRGKAVRPDAGRDHAGF